MKLPLKWEFPGGKIEQNETAENCLLREIREELSIDIRLLKQISSKPFKYDTFSVCLIPFISEYVQGEIILAEHKQFKWLLREELRDLDWAAADIPVLEEFLKMQL